MEHARLVINLIPYTITNAQRLCQNVQSTIWEDHAWFAKKEADCIETNASQNNVKK
jgi:hypothetical protein